VTRIAPALAALLVSTAATAQSTTTSQTIQTRDEAARLLIGFSGIGDGFYCAYGYVYSSCSNLGYDYVPFTIGGEVEFGGRVLGVALGVYDLNGAYNNVNRNFVEPIADLVFRFGTYTEGPVFRFRLGAGVYIGPDWNAGLVGRIGVGATLRGRGRLGLAAEFGWEGGEFAGNAISTIRLVVGPEFAF
jgi:hypothetical protein